LQNWVRDKRKQFKANSLTSSTRKFESVAMNRNNRFVNPNDDDIFEMAVSRLQAGESIADILASYPPAMHDELSDMLNIVEVTEQMKNAPIPRPSAARRATAKRQFLATAAQMRLEQQSQSIPPIAAATSTATTRPISRPAARRAARRSMSSWERFMAGMKDMFGSGAMRLAPAIIVIAVVVFGTSTLWQASQAAVPGDSFYGLKQTIRKLELDYAPSSQREMVRQQIEKDVAADVKKAAEHADANNVVLKAEDTLVYYGRNGNLLKIGKLKVIDQYQPDANAEGFEKMTIDGDLKAGAQVKVAYQIMPGQTDTVQGIALTVVAPPNEAEVIPVDVPATVLQQPSTCAVTQPEGWVAYTVKSGDNLTFLAKRGNSTVEKIVDVNCLTDTNIVIGAELYVPAASVNADVPTAACGSEIPQGWVLYEVKSGDNLYGLADRTGTTLDEIERVNCLDSESINTIVIGSQLYLPAEQ
jgi:LysM repeat protein